MLLGKLVHKFKKQSLQEEKADTVATAAATVNSAVELRTVRKSARLNPGIVTAENESNAVKKETEASKTDTISSSSSSSSAALFRSVDEELSLMNPAATVYDSGTESDEEELERLESMSNDARSIREGSRAAVPTQHSAGGEELGASPPALISSPQLISEIDTSSWDSMGCESGIVLRESVERDDSSRDFDSSLDGCMRSTAAPATDENWSAATPIAQQRGTYFAKDFSGASKTLRNGAPLDFSALRERNTIVDPVDTILMTRSAADAAPQSSTADGKKGGAFRPVVRQRARRNSNGNGSNNAGGANNNGNATSIERPLSAHNLALLDETSRTSTPSPNNLIGEKRRWAAVASATTTASSGVIGGEAPNNDDGNLPIASRTRGSLLAYANIYNNSAEMGGSMGNLSPQEVPRAVLTARRTRVRVLYYQGQENAASQLLHRSHAKPSKIALAHHRLSLGGSQTRPDEVPFGESPPAAPLLANKRGRLASSASASKLLVESENGVRPSLDFDKMRERMMGASIPLTSLNDTR